MKDSVNTVRCSVDSRLIIAKFVSYNDQALPLSCLPDVTHMTLSPRPSPSVFAYCKRPKTGGGNGLGTRLYLPIRHLRLWGQHLGCAPTCLGHIASNPLAYSNTQGLKQKKGWMVKYSVWGIRTYTSPSLGMRPCPLPVWE